MFPKQEAVLAVCWWYIGVSRWLFGWFWPLSEGMKRHLQPELYRWLWNLALMLNISCACSQHTCDMGWFTAYRVMCPCRDANIDVYMGEVGICPVHEQYWMNISILFHYYFRHTMIWEVNFLSQLEIAADSIVFSVMTCAVLMSYYEYIKSTTNGWRIWYGMVTDGYKSYGS